MYLISARRMMTELVSRWMRSCSMPMRMTHQKESWHSFNNHNPNSTTTTTNNNCKNTTNDINNSNKTTNNICNSKTNCNSDNDNNNNEYSNATRVLGDGELQGLLADHPVHVLPHLAAAVLFVLLVVVTCLHYFRVFFLYTMYLFLFRFVLSTVCRASWR